MSKREGFLKDDDFWNDCFRDSIFTQNILDRHHIKQSLLKNQSKLINEILNEEEQKQKRKKEASKHCFTLYNHCFIRNEIMQSKANKNKKKLEEEELATCTWKPKLTRKKSYNIKLKAYSDMQMYKRGALHIQKHNENIARHKYTKSLEEHELTFKPKLANGCQLSTVFQMAIKTSFEKDSNRLFICRYHKAREEEEYKKSRRITDLSKNIGAKWEKRGIKRSISNKDSCVIKQTLHDNLLSCEGNLTDNKH